MSRTSAESPSRWERALHFLNRDLWSPEQTARRSVAWARNSLQLAVLVSEEFVRHQLLLRASALTYYSMLSLIPLLAIALSLVGALGVREDLARVLVEYLAAGSPEAGPRILAIVDKLDFAGLGTLGAAILFLTTVLGISSIERSLNTIWGVSRERPWERRIPDYLAVLILAPLILGVALSLGTTLQSQAIVQWLLQVPGFERLFNLGLRQAPLVFLSLGFAFIYWFLPNTRVRILPALLAGVFAAILFTVAQRVYVGFYVGVGRANWMFGGFAFLPLLLVWIYISWVIMLIGAEVAFALQNLALVRQARRGKDPGPAAREALGLAIAERVARSFRDGDRAEDSEALAETLRIPVRSVREILAKLHRAGIVAPSADERDAYQLGRAAESVRVSDVLDALRGPRDASAPLGELDPAVGRVIEELDRSSEQALAGRTLADLLEAPSGPRGSPPEEP
jgi:membrane protein